MPGSQGLEVTNCPWLPGLKPCQKMPLALTFEVLKQKALPRILEGRPKDYVMRGWVPGCSSG
ncbi:MAG: hypothetical protein V1689_11840 [Pseudomonadota bacterium]